MYIHIYTYTFQEPSSLSEWPPSSGERPCAKSRETSPTVARSEREGSPRRTPGCGGASREPGSQESSRVRTQRPRSRAARGGGVPRDPVGGAQTRRGGRKSHKVRFRLKRNGKKTKEEKQTDNKKKT